MDVRAEMLVFCFSRIWTTLTEVLGRDIRANDPRMSAGCPSQKLPLWAAFSFLDFSRDQKENMTARGVTGFYAFLDRKSSKFLGAVSLPNCTEKLEKKDKIHWRKFKKSSGDGAPKLEISVPCRGRTCPDFRLESFSLKVVPFNI